MVAPAYDSMAPVERSAYIKANPSNFIKTMRTPEDYFELEKPSLKMVLDHNSNEVQKMLEDSSFEIQQQEALYIYRLHTGDHVQTAVIAEVPVTEYQQGRIHRHEHTRAEHENRLTQYLQHVGVSSSPICLAYQDDARIVEIVELITQGEPLLDFSLDDGVRQSIWEVIDTEQIDSLRTKFLDIGVAYLTDGHHRMDALLKLSKFKQHQNPNHTGEEAYNFFMIAIFPTSQARILDYNRLIKDLYGYSPKDFIKEIKKKFKVEKQNSSFKPKKSQIFGMYLEKQWYSLELKEKPHQNLFHIINLDINLLHYYLLEPTLGIGDPRYDNRIDFLAGFHGLEGIEKKVNSGEAKIGFALFATQMENIINFADQKLTMPPKSTWFDPKPLDGLVAYDFE